MSNNEKNFNPEKAKSNLESIIKYQDTIEISLSGSPVQSFSIYAFGSTFLRVQQLILYTKGINDTGFQIYEDNQINVYSALNCYEARLSIYTNTSHFIFEIRQTQNYQDYPKLTLDVINLKNGKKYKHTGFFQRPQVDDPKRYEFELT